MAKDFDIENFPESERAKRMLTYVTDGFYERSYVGKWLYEVMGREHDTIHEISDTLPDQLFIETATWGLKYHEMLWGVPVRENLPYDVRRAEIIRRRDLHVPMSPYYIELYLETSLPFDAVIADIHDPSRYGFVPSHPNIFKVFLVCGDDGETLDSKYAHKLVNTVKQSHTIYTMQQRIELVHDNSELEIIDFVNIHFKMAAPFWDCHVWDGDWLLNGPVLLNQKRRYQLALHLFNKWKIWNPPDEIDFVSLRQGFKVVLEEEYKAKVEFSTGICWWWIHTERRLNGEVLLDGSIGLDTGHYFRLNGELNLSGGTLLDEKHPYWALLRIAERYKIYSLTEGVDFVSLVQRFKAAIEESFRMRASYHYEAYFFAFRLLDGERIWDGSWLLNGFIGNQIDLRTAFHAKAEIPEDVGEATVFTRTRDYWFLDGEVMMDGSRKVNSVYRKEIAV